MSTPLKFGDPSELGSFRLSSRLHESPAGIVYLGADAQGRPVEVALLTMAAAGDAAARDRFRAAVREEMPRPDAVPRTPPPLAPDDPAPVVAAEVEGDTPWVATAHEEDRVGAARFLEPVLLKRGWAMRRRRGPQFQPYWAGGPQGAAAPTLRPATAGAPSPADTKALATAAAALAALLALLLVLLVLLFACEPSEPEPPPVRTTSVPPPVTLTPGTPTPRRSSPVPVPRPTGTGDVGNPATTR